MPKFETHISVAALSSAVAVAAGAARFGWDGGTASLAFIAGAAGGMLPDLDSDQGKPRRIAAGIVGIAAAAGVVSFVTAPGEFLKRPWAPGAVCLAALGAYFLFNIFFVEIVKRHSRHRGLFHSLAVPFLYGGLLAMLAVPHGGELPMAVWALGVWGVFSHLLLDAAKGLTIDPLKLKDGDLKASAWLWAVTAFVNLAAFTRVTRF